MLPRRFWDKVLVATPDECWMWKGATTSHGYGAFKVNGRICGAHILSLEAESGEAANGRFVCHSCDNPSCCNPKHLWFGTNSDNQKDCTKKGRRPPTEQTGVLNGRAVLNEDAVREIRRLSAIGHSNTTLGCMFGVTHSNIYRIKRRQSWKHI